MLNNRSNSIDDSALNSTEQADLVHKESHHMIGSKSYKFFSANKSGLGEIEDPHHEEDYDKSISRKFLVESVKEFYESKSPTLITISKTRKSR